MAQYDLILTQNTHVSGVEYSEKYVNIAKGGILSANSSGVPTVLAVGTDTYHLVANSATATGLEWQVQSAGHTQNTDTGTTAASFIVNSGSVIGKMILSPTTGAANFSLTLTNAALTGSDKTATFQNATGTVALLGNKLSDFAATTSAELAGIISDETGTAGKLVFSTSPTFSTSLITDSASFNMFNTVATSVTAFGAATTLNLGLSGNITLGTSAAALTTAIVGGAITGNTLKIAGTTSGTVNITTDVTTGIANLFTSLTTGTLNVATAGASQIVLGGAASTTTVINLVATKVNNMTITSSTGTFTLAAAKILTVNNTLTFSGTDSSSVAFGTGGTVAYIGGKLNQFAATTSAELMGVISDETGSGGALVFATGPTLSLPIIDNLKLGYTTTVTSGGTLTLTNASNLQQYFTGTSAHTCVLPVTSTLVLGESYMVTNNSTQAVTVQSSGANNIFVMPGGTSAMFTCILTSGTSAASWSASYDGFSTLTGTGACVLATSPTLVTPVLGVATATSINKVAFTQPATSATLTIADGKTATINNTLTFTGTDSSSVAFGTGGTVAYTGGTLAQFAATTSAQLAGVLSDETGYSGGALAVFNISPSFATSVVTSSSSFDVFNTTATTLNAFGAATTLTVGYTGTGANTTNIATGATLTATTKTINIGTGGAAGSTTNINLGSTNAGTVTVNHDLTVVGNLIVQGTTTTINSETLTIDDNVIVLNNNYAGASPTENGGIEVERGTQTNASLIWDETADKWKAGLAGAEVEIMLVGAQSWVSAPATKTSSGTAGTQAYDGNYYYICTATNTWKRVPLATNW